MNDIQCLIDRQLGFYCRLNYDSVLKRLVVDGEESFYGLQSANVVTNYDQDPPIFACRFAEASGYEHILALANEDGRVAIQNTTNFKTARTLESFQCHNNAVFDLAWMPGHMNFVTVSGDHTACLWDVGEGAPRRVLVFANHTRSVKTAAFSPAAPAELATGARDGHILVWDVRAGAQPAVVLKPDNSLASCHSSFLPKTPGSHGKRARLDAQRAVSITGLVFQRRHALLSCAECDGNIKVWDLRKNYSAHTREPLPQHSIPYCGSSARNGYTNLLLDAARTRLYASCMDSVIYCFNVATYDARPERRYAGHESGTFYIKTGLSADGAYLVSGSSDKRAYVWSVRRAAPALRLAGHAAEVTCAAWCQRGDPKLVTCGDDARHMIWRVGPESPGGFGAAGAPLRGRAEPAPPAAAALPAWGTPSALKRRREPDASGAKRARLGGGGGAERPERRTKRCLTALLNASRDVDDADSMVKRLKLDAPDERPAAPAKRPPAAAWRAGPAPPPPGEACRQPSPRPAPSPPKQPARSLSPCTRDLPDFVQSGEAPHLRLMSPAKKKPDSTDWLTALRGRRAPPAAPAATAPLAPLTPRENVPARRNSVSEKTPKSSKKCRTLLKYFSVTTEKK